MVPELVARERTSTLSMLMAMASPTVAPSTATGQETS
jgi:hypothetical protein